MVRHNDLDRYAIDSAEASPDRLDLILVDPAAFPNHRARGVDSDDRDFFICIGGREFRSDRIEVARKWGEITRTRIPERHIMIARHQNLSSWQLIEKTSSRSEL